MTCVAFACYCHGKMYWDSFDFGVPPSSSVSTVCVAGGLLLWSGCSAGFHVLQKVCRVPQSQTSLTYFYCCIRCVAWSSLSNPDSAPSFIVWLLSSQSSEGYFILRISGEQEAPVWVPNSMDSPCVASRWWNPSWVFPTGQWAGRTSSELWHMFCLSCTRLYWAWTHQMELGYNVAL